MDDRQRARAYLDAPKPWLSWASLGNVSHAWERFPATAMGVMPESRATVCGVESTSPAAWISGPGITRCPECARIEAEHLAREFAAVRRESLEEAAMVCDEAARGVLHTYESREEARSLASSIRALATPTKPGDNKG